MARSLILASFFTAGVYALRVAQQSAEHESQVVAHASDFIPGQLLPGPRSVAMPGAAAVIHWDTSMRVGDAPQINLHGGVGRRVVFPWMSMQGAEFIPDLPNDWKSAYNDWWLQLEAEEEKEKKEKETQLQEFENDPPSTVEFDVDQMSGPIDPIPVRVPEKAQEQLKKGDVVRLKNQAHPQDDGLRGKVDEVGRRGCTIRLMNEGNRSRYFPWDQLEKT